MASTALGRVVECAEAVVLGAPDLSDAGAALTAAVFRSAAGRPDERLDGQVERQRDGGPGEPPAIAFLDLAIERALDVAGPTADVAAAFRDVAHHLRWGQRPPGRADPDGFRDGHANAILIGPNGLDRRHGVTLGATLMAPNVRYPDHHHPPEEFYVVLSPGQWRQGEGAWHEPGPGGVVIHAADVVHSMRAGDVPLLALWFLQTS